MAVEGVAELMILEYLSKVVTFHAVMAQRGSIGLAPRILNLGTRGTRAVNIRFDRYPARKEPKYPFSRWLVGPREPVWLF